MSNNIQTKTKREEVKELVISLIKENNLKTGDRILSDNQLAKLCKVSPLTANRALVDMENAGILNRIKGKGTFIKRNPGKSLSVNAALVMADPANYINGHIIQKVHQGLLNEIGDRGKVSTIIHYPDDDCVEMFDNLQGYDVIFFIGYGRYKKLIELIFAKTSLPIVVLAEETDTEDCLNIYTDKSGNTISAIAHLAKHGYRRIGYIGSATPHLESNKLTGYKAALEHWGLPLDERRIVTGIDSQQEGARGASILFNRGLDCDALFIDTDLKAVDAIEYFRKVGIRIPEDLAVVSYDGLEPYLSGPPYLSSINIDYQKMIKKAFERLKNKNFDKNEIVGKIVYHSKLKIGKTCGCTSVNTNEG